MIKYFTAKDGIVTNVLVIDESMPKPKVWLEENFGGQWEKATDEIGVGYIYYEQEDAFLLPKPFDSWVLDEETAQWEAPVEYPTDGKDYSWDEETTSWVEIPTEETNG